jgi:hypothetical protein
MPAAMSAVSLDSVKDGSGMFISIKMAGNEET